jgi:signal transduction histidine kinase
LDIVRVICNIKEIYLKVTREISNFEKPPDNVTGDKQRLQQVLINLLNNAISNTYQGGVTLDLSYDYENMMMKFRVADTGSGIKPEDQIEIQDFL